MSTTRRATIYLDPEVHRALRLKAAATDQSISDMVNAALKRALAEDAEDLEAFGKRRAEESIDFEEFVKALKRRGRL
jgi:plasmid stability protein